MDTLPLAAVAGLVLAAGASVRMGEDKLLLELEGESLLRRAVRAALAAGLSPVVVVLGPGCARAREELAGLACSLVVNPEPGRGQGSSLAAGIAAVPASAAAAVVLLPDMPRVTAEMISAVVARFRETAAPLVLSDYAGTLAPPALYAQPLLGELSALAAAAGERPSQALVARHRSRAEVLRWPAADLADVDTQADLLEARARAAAAAKA